MATALLLLIIGAAGWALGRMRPQVNAAMAVMAVFAAVMAHSGLQWAFLEGRLDTVVLVHQSLWSVVLIAAGEALGLWLPILLVPWAKFSARLYGGLYVLAACTTAAVAFYFPDDLRLLSPSLMPTDGPPYLLAAFALVPVAALGWAAGWMRMKGDDTEEEPEERSGHL